MRNRTMVSISAGLLALGSACGGDGAGGGGAGGAASGAGPGTGVTTGAGGGTGGGTSAACSVVARGLPVGAAPASQPSLLWTGSGYAIAWTDAGAGDKDIRLALLDAEGTVQTSVVLASGVELSSHPSVALVGGRVLVLWQDITLNGSAVRGRFVGLDGQLQGGALTIAPSAVEESWPILAGTSAGAAAVWMDQGGAKLGMLGQDGALSSQVTVNGASYPAIAVDGADMGLAWSLGDNVAFGRPDASGAMSPVFHDGVVAGLTRVSFGGGAAFVVWEDMRAGVGNEDIYAVRVGADGSVSSETRVPAALGSANWPAAVWTGEQLAIAYYQFRDGPPRVYLELLAPDLKPARVDLEVSGAAAARFPSVAWNPDAGEIAVAYAERDGGAYLSRVTCP